MKRSITIERIDSARIFLLSAPDGVTAIELALHLDMTREAALKMLKDLGAVRGEGKRDKWTLPISDSLALLAGVITEKLMKWPNP